MSAGIYLGFDFGEKRIGVAAGDAVTRTARPLCTLAAGDWAGIERLVREWRPAACVVGLPLSNEGGEQIMTEKARAFANALTERCGAPVYLCDERHSSLAAQSQLRQGRADGIRGRHLRQTDVDSTAAQLILEQWLAQQS